MRTDKYPVLTLFWQLRLLQKVQGWLFDNNAYLCNQIVEHKWPKDNLSSAPIKSPHNLKETFYEPYSFLQKQITLNMHRYWVVSKELWQNFENSKILSCIIHTRSKHKTEVQNWDVKYMHILLIHQAITAWNTHKKEKYSYCLQRDSEASFQSLDPQAK